MAAHLVATKVAGCTTTESAHEASVTLGLCIGISGTVILSLLAVLAVLALGILVLRIAALLGELLSRCLARVRLLSVGAAVIKLVIVSSLVCESERECLPLGLVVLLIVTLLAVLEATVCRGSVTAVLLLLAVLVLWRILLLVLVPLVVATLLWRTVALLARGWRSVRGSAVLIVWRVLLAVLMVLAVLVVGVRHCGDECAVWIEDGGWWLPEMVAGYVLRGAGEMTEQLRMVRGVGSNIQRT